MVITYISQEEYLMIKQLVPDLFLTENFQTETWKDETQADGKFFERLGNDLLQADGKLAEGLGRSIEEVLSSVLRIMRMPE